MSERRELSLRPTIATMYLHSRNHFVTSESYLSLNQQMMEDAIRLGCKQRQGASAAEMLHVAVNENIDVV